MNTGKEIIEAELKKLSESVNPEAHAPFGLDYYESCAYVQGLMSAYLHALEMWDGS